MKIIFKYRFKRGAQTEEMLIKYKNNLSVLFFLLLLTLLSCAPNITLKITIDENCFPSDISNLKVFLLDEEVNQELSEIISSNKMYMKTISYRIYDSLRTLQRFYNETERNFNRVSEVYSQKLKKLPMEYIKYVKVKPVSIQKFGNTWKLWVKFYNCGQDKLEGLNITIQYNDEILANDQYITILLNEGGAPICKEICFDLSDNLPLQLKMASHSGGLEELCSVLTCRVTSVSSKFLNSIKPYQKNIDELSKEIEKTTFEIESLLEARSDEVQSRVVDPVNKILENRLKEVAQSTEEISPFDTVKFTALKKGSFALIVYSSPLDSNQWYKTINLTDSRDLYLSGYDRCPFFLQLTRPAIPVESDNENNYIDIDMDFDDYVVRETPTPEKKAGPTIRFIPYDEPPTPIGGFEAIQRNVIYPEIAQEAGIEGTVVIRAFVDKKGIIQDCVILKGMPNTGLDEAAISVIKKTRFIPAILGNKEVSVYVSIPVIFKLKN